MEVARVVRVAEDRRLRDHGHVVLERHRGRHGVVDEHLRADEDAPADVDAAPPVERRAGGRRQRRVAGDDVQPALADGAEDAQSLRLGPDRDVAPQLLEHPARLCPARSSLLDPQEGKVLREVDRRRLRELVAEADRLVEDDVLPRDRPALEGLRALEAAQRGDDRRPHRRERQGAERLRRPERPDGERPEQRRDVRSSSRSAGRTTAAGPPRRARAPSAPRRARAATARRGRAGRAGPGRRSRTPPPRSRSASARSAAARVAPAEARRRAPRARSRRSRAPAAARRRRRCAGRGRSPDHLALRCEQRVPRDRALRDLDEPLEQGAERGIAVARQRLERADRTGADAPMPSARQTVPCGSRICPAVSERSKRGPSILGALQSAPPPRPEPDAGRLRLRGVHLPAVPLLPAPGEDRAEPELRRHLLRRERLPLHDLEPGGRGLETVAAADSLLAEEAEHDAEPVRGDPDRRERGDRVPVALPQQPVAEDRPERPDARRRQVDLPDDVGDLRDREPPGGRVAANRRRATC